MGCLFSKRLEIERMKTPEQAVVIAPLAPLAQQRHLNEFYDIEEEKILGTGLNGTVKACVHRQTKLQFALKSLSKRDLKPDGLRKLRVEIDIMMGLDHPNILSLHEFFETEEELLLVLELCSGGELIDRLHEQEDKKFSEPVAKRLIFTMLSAIEHCHSNCVIHRDLKLENFLFTNKTDDAQLKLIDFGLSQYFRPGEMLHKSLGTPSYVSPEVLAGHYNYKCDIWAIGVITYMLLSGEPPFYGKDERATLQSVRYGKWKFPEESFKDISAEAKHFIRICLSLSLSSRPTAAVAMTHKWFKTLILE